MESICHRLSVLSELHLPASMTRDRVTSVSKAEIEEFLKDLIRRDPSVFLERYGSMLESSELECFTPLASDYEVAFYLSKFKKPKTDSLESKALKVKNRRMAELDRLIEEGEYFGDSAMRDREPFLYKQYISKYAHDASTARPNKPRTLSESLMQSAEEQELQERLDRAAAVAEEEEEEDECEEIEDEEFMRHEFLQIMKERFLTGKDGDYVDYDRIDNDLCLDDDLLRIETQDQEEKYFQSDD